MKKTKVIIPALGLLLLSTAASVTGTVAWFAANTSVTANGMSITATTDSTFLLISKSSDLSAKATTVSLAAPSGEVLPTNWVNNTGYKWVSAVGTDTTTAAKNGDYANLTIAEASNFGSVTATGKKYYVYDSVWVGLADGSSIPSTQNLKCNVSFTAGTASNLNKCLTVGIDAENNMGTSADFDERYLMGAADSATVNGSSSLIAGSSLSTTAKEIKIYAFFNGDDANCTTANAISLDAITINLTFTLA